MSDGRIGQPQGPKIPYVNDEPKKIEGSNGELCLVRNDPAFEKRILAMIMLSKNEISSHLDSFSQLIDADGSLFLDDEAH